MTCRVAIQQINIEAAAGRFAGRRGGRGGEVGRQILYHADRAKGKEVPAGLTVWGVGHVAG